ncbi:MAG: RusA family crossover junction endodeoxyribonuclease [Candidatus Micrarchaeia archaeon]|jgi:Holliday junction resolvase RusA-like endonuclease
MKFTIILEPKGQMRARGRAFLAGGKAIAGKPRKDPKQQTEEEKLLALLYKYRPQTPLTGALVLGVKAFLPMTKSDLKGKKGEKFKAEALTGAICPTKKPDLDNIIKHLKDVFKGVFWTDDALVVKYAPETGKYYGDPARWEIELITLEEYRAGLAERYRRLMLEAQDIGHYYADAASHAEFNGVEAGRLF